VKNAAARSIFFDWSGHEIAVRTLERFRGRTFSPLGNCFPSSSELGQKVGDRLVSLRLVLLQASQDEPGQGLGHLRVDFPGIGRPLRLVLKSDAERRISVEGCLSRHHLEEDDAERVDVRAAVGWRPLRLLRRHVLGGADHGPAVRDAFLFERAGQPEIHDPSVALTVDDDIPRLQVPVHYTEPVGFGQPGADLSGDRDGLGRAEPSHHPDDALQVLSLDIFHRDIGSPLLIVDIMHPADILVSDAAGQPDLLPEPVERLRPEGQLGADELERDRLFQLIVVDLVDPAHPAAAELLDHFIPAGEKAASRKILEGTFEALRLGEPVGFSGLREGGGAVGAIVASFKILGATLRTLHGPFPRRRNDAAVRISPNARIVKFEERRSD
jgi:hypothetical protein